MPSEETTTKFKVDISQLKKEFQEAQRHIQLVNSEFKAATAGMDKWSNNADGLGAKIKQLNGVLVDEQAKLKSLEKQYALVAQEQGENSKGAQELMIKINNQKAAVEQIQSSISHYTDKLNDLTSESKEAESATDKLRNTISQQESDLESLKAKYSNLVLEQGKSSQGAKDTAVEISKLSSELQQNKTALNKAETAADEFDNTLDDVRDSTEEASDGFTVMKGALADLLADGIKSVVGGLKAFVTESDRAYKKFQAATGASTEEMKEFKGEMNDLYENAYGESLQDIGDKMAYIKQVTGETDPSKIRELAENAMTLEDTFDSDFDETIRGVNNLMKHFGINSEEAFDLFAKGSKLGLDYTHELGDNIAEYGGNFEQAGYSAEEYFQLLVNGSQGGAYNLDKVNDSINEVKNRLGDGTIEKNLDLFSDGTKSAFKAWKKGKGTMKDVINSIVKDISSCENEQEALTMAATAFGTMGEDANLKVVKSLTTVGTSFKNVSGTMEEMKDIRYDDVGTQFTELGRKLQNQLLKPLAEKALPYFKKFGDVAIDNVDAVANAIKVLGGILTTVFVVNKVATFTQSLSSLASTLGIVKGAATALNAAWLASPVTWVTAGVAALAAGLMYLNSKQEEAIEKEYGLSEAQQKSIDKAAELKKSYDQITSARNESNLSINSEYSHISELKDEYNSLIDKNGKVKEGYEDRANFIMTTLADSLGLEQDEIQKLIDKNGQLGDSIDDIIQKKQAEATLNANEAAYTEAIQRKTEALSAYQDSLTTLESAEKKYSDTKEKANEVMDTYEMLLKSNPEAANGYLMGQYKIIKANDEAKEAYDKAKKGVEDAEDAYVGYNTTIQNYEGLSAAIISGDVDKINVSLQNMQNGFVIAETGTRSSLEKQVSNMRKTYEDLVTAVNDGTPGVTQAQVLAAAKMVEAAQKELDKLPPEAKKSGEESGKAHAEGVKSKAADNENAGKKVSESTNEGLDSSDTKKTGKEKGLEYKEGVQSTNKSNVAVGKNVSSAVNSAFGFADTKATGKSQGLGFGKGVGGTAGTAKTEGKNVANSAKGGMGSVSANGPGKNLTGTFNTGIKSVPTKEAGKGRASDAKSGMESVKTNSTGNNFTQGFVNGMSSGAAASSIWDKAWSLGKKALSALKKSIKEGSPSKLTYRSGGFFVEGFANAIGDGAKLAINKAKELGKESLEALNKELDTGVNVPSLKSNMQMTRNAIRNNPVGSQTGRNSSVNNTYNFYQTNNSPKSLSRLEIYRQTRNQLNFAKGVS